jgi:predicted DNA-binding protein
MKKENNIRITVDLPVELYEALKKIRDVEKAKPTMSYIVRRIIVERLKEIGDDAR